MERTLKILLVLVLFTILFLSFVSAVDINNLWNKITGRATTDYCTDNCTSLGYQCGTGKICENFIYCGNCSEEYGCINGICVNLTLIDSCDTNATLNETAYDCEIENKTCLNGLCVTPPICTDSDNGIKYYTKGTVIYAYEGFSIIINDKSNLTDYCFEDYLNEAFCFFDAEGIAQFGWESIACRYKCVNGACNTFFSSLFNK